MRAAPRVRPLAVLLVSGTTIALLGVGVVAGARGGGDQPGAFTAPFGDGEVAVAIQPAAVGANEVHVYVTDATGSPHAVADPAVRITDGDGDPRPINVTAVAPGHLVAVQQHLGASGDHTVTVEATVDGTIQRASGTIDVRDSAGLARRVVEWCTLQLSRARR